MDITGYIAEKGAQIYNMLLIKAYMPFSQFSQLKDELPKGAIETGMLMQHPFLTMSVWAAYKLKIPKTIKKISKKAPFKTTGSSSEAGDRDLGGML